MMNRSSRPMNSSLTVLKRSKIKISEMTSSQVKPELNKNSKSSEYLFKSTTPIQNSDDN